MLHSQVIMIQANQFLEYAVTRRLYSGKSRLFNHLSYIFGRNELYKRRLLDIGGGTGLLSFWMAVNGGSAICLEPEFHGSSTGMQEAFQSLARDLDVSPEQAQQQATTFQDFELDEKFDIIILANSINHLNEEATINLQCDPDAVSVYVSYFEKMRNLLSDGGRVIITDCDRHNFFNTFGLKSPFMPSIEWQKHQSPRFWGKLLQKAGFKIADISWSSPNILGLPGRFFLGNRIIAYFLLSHFRIEAIKK